MTSRVVDIADLRPAERRQMHALLDAHFAGVTQEQFDADLAGKSHAILLSADDRLAGFSTLRAYEKTFDGEVLTVIYSGDTIVSPAAWGTPTLPRAWIGAVNQVRRRAGDRRCFWLLITSGFRTYRFLPVFWRQFYPRFDAPTPTFHQRLMNELATDQFGDAFDAGRGVVRFPRPQILRPALAGVPEGRTDDPHVAFFAARNPGHAAGDELVSLCEISDDNLTRAGERMVRGR